MVRMRKGLWLFEFENSEEVDRVLKRGRRRCGGNLLCLKKWGLDLGCMSRGDIEEKAWVREVGLLVHLWSWKILRKIGGGCGGFVVVDEDTVSLFELCCARILVRLRDFDPPKFVEVVVGGNNFMIQLWWEIFPYLETKQSSEKKMGLRHNGKEGEARCGGGESGP